MCIRDRADGVRMAHAREVIVLPNNGNVVLTAQQAAGVPDIGDTKVHVVPSKTVPQGLAALLVMTPYAPLEENVAKMVDAIGRVVSEMCIRDSPQPSGSFRQSRFLPALSLREAQYVSCR